MRTVTVTLLMAALAAGAHGKVVDRVAAVVNGRIVTLSEVEERAAMGLSRADHLDGPERRSSARRQAYQDALDQLISERLLEAEVQTAQIEVAPEELDEAVAQVKEQNKLTDEQLEQALGDQGMTMEKYREQMRTVLQRQKLVSNKVKSKVKVTDDDVKSYYAKLVAGLEGEEEVRARHILILVPKDAPPEKVREAEARARKALARVRAGEDFAAVAREVSEGPTAPQGGDLGWFKKGTMVEEFDRVAFSLKKGEISEPVRTTYGVHVVQLVDRRKSNARPLAEVQDRIREQLYREEMERQTENYLRDLRRQAAVTVKVDPAELARDEG